MGVLVSDFVHIGKILVEHGVLNEMQVFEILEAQRQKNLPFGVLAEQMFDVTLSSIERAWIEQYHRMTGTIDLSQQTVDESTLGVINRRQAWQFEMMPLRFEDSGELIVVAGRRRLARAVTFATNTLTPVVYFRIAEEEPLRELLQKHYPMPEVSQRMIDRAKEFAWSSPEEELRDAS